MASVPPANTQLPLLFSDLTQRCLCLAGLEAATGLRMR